MIRITKNIDTTKILTWCEKILRPQLTKDVSNYAVGRERLWLHHEPMLFKPFHTKPAVECHPKTWNRLRELIEWEFDYCLVTYSGTQGIGISPHRDAGYANYEAYGLNISGTCEFHYWNDRQSFTGGVSSGFAPHTQPATDILHLKAGDVTRFNCKNLHSATPSANRWAMNFWRKK